MAKKEVPEPKKRGASTVEMVAYKLNDTELVAKGRSLVEQIKACEELAEKHADKKRTMKLEADNAQAVVVELREVIETGTEQRPVDCYEEHDFKKGIVIIRRADNDEIVTHRKMTDDERQQSIAGLEGALATPPGDGKTTTKKARGAAPDAKGDDEEEENPAPPDALA